MDPYRNRPHIAKVKPAFIGNILWIMDLRRNPRAFAGVTSAFAENLCCSVDSRRVLLVFAGVTPAFIVNPFYFWNHAETRRALQEQRPLSL